MLAALCAVLLPFPCPAADHTGARQPFLAVGACKGAPTIDGVLAPNEWDGAACGGGIRDLGSGRLLAVQPRFYLAFDDTALYFAAAVPVVRGAQLRAQQRDRDGAVYSDDSVELFLDPGTTRKRCYQFVVNSIGALFDAEDRNAKWNSPGARAAARKTDREWVLELSVPFVDLGVQSPADGTQWGANVCLNYPSRGKLTGSWAKVTSGFHDPANFARIAFTRSGPVVAVAGFDALLSGRGALALRLVGTGTAKSQLKIWPKGAEETPVVDVQRQSGGNWTLPFRLPDAKPGVGTQSFAGELRVTRTDAPLLVLPFTVDMTSLLSVRISAFPDSKTLEVEVTPGPRFTDPARYSCRISMETTDRKAAKTVELPTLKEQGPTTVIFEEHDIPAGDVTVHAEILDRNGNVVFEHKRNLSDPLKPWWLNDTTGAEDVIPSPYEPLRTKGNAILPWGRLYRFGSCLLPTEVETAGASVLAGPVALNVSVAGRRLPWRGNPPRVKEKRPGRIALDGSATCEALRLSGTAVVEYDGMIRVDLELTPIGTPHIDKLTIEIPLKPEHAEYLYHFPGKWRSVANSGKLPAKGFRNAFKPFVWLGDNDRGFSWFCESAENWLPEDRDDAITIDREGDRVVLRLHLLQGQSVKEPLKYTFGFEATPNKKPGKTPWDYRISHAGRYGIQAAPGQPAVAAIQYPAAGNIRGDRGTAEMWIAPSLDSDPARAGEQDHTQVPNVTLFWLDIDAKTNCGLFWCGPPQQLRIWSRVDGKVLTTLSVPVKWKKGELHHVAFSWGDELAIYLDGTLKAKKAYKGLMPKTLENAVLHIGKASSPLLVDEIRVSDVARTPELERQPYAPDEHTLLLDHLDLDIQTFQTHATEPAVAHGGTGNLTGTPESVPGKHGKAARLSTAPEATTLLDQLVDAGVRTLCFHSQWSWMGYPMPPPEREQDLRDLVAACHAKGIQLLLYASPLTADQAPEWDLYHKYFLIEPLKWPYRYDDGHLAPACCWQSRYRNLWLARQARLMDDYDIDGFYLDGSEWPLDCRNEAHGCGYRRKDGKIGTTCNIFGTRDYMKRLYTLCRTRKPNAQLNIHNSTVMVIPTLGWGTSSWGGEQLGSLSWDKGGAVDKREYALDALPLDAFRTEFMGRQWGVPSEFLCYERPYTTPQILAITLLHDVLVRPNMPHLPRLSAIWRLYDTFGMKDATWYPYWNNGDLFPTNQPHVKVSAYGHPDRRVLLLVSNLSSEAAEAQITLSTGKLGLKPAGLKARDATTGEPVELTGGRVRCAVQPFSYRYVWVE